MQKWINYFLLFSIVCHSFAGAQESNIPKKVQIEKTGCAMYFFGTPSAWEITELGQNDTLFVAQSDHNDIKYGAFIIKYDKVDDKIFQKEIKTQNMLNLLGVFKETYNIKRCVGEGLGRTLNNYPDVVGALDYCEDESQNQFSIHSWSNGKIVAILFVASADVEPNINMQELFFNGFRFP